ncbi:MAG TPA: Hsp70 family protein, partial [Longimicrobium sp.]|nr:Hsp70 family protein [Longimicrobium sp.]
DRSQPARILELDPSAEDARLLRSVLFFPEDTRDVYVGDPAIRHYLDEAEGRFLQSLKSFLNSPSFERTEIRRQSWKLEDLVALLLRRIREQVEKLAGGAIERVVLGRPAVFDPDPERDRLAETRLARAAQVAGFPAPTFVIEPIAAALSYEASLSHDETVLVGDFGAGTSDFTLMSLGPSRRADADRRKDVLGASGVRIGGDRFDAAIVEHRLLKWFGEGATYLALTKQVELPRWLTRKLLAWHELSVLRERSTLEFLRNAEATSDTPEPVGNLIRLVEENLAYHLYRSVEVTKRRLSAAEEAPLSFHHGGIDIEERVTRAEFEAWTAPLREQLMASVDECLRQGNGAMPDAVFLTGGTSRIPSVRQLFAERFGEERLREGDAFTSVASGLGRAASQG